MTQVRRIAFEVSYNGKDITTDVTTYVTGLTYTDKTEGESDTVELTMDDTDGLWRNSWYPTKGDTLTVSMGYDDLLLPCGQFEIDEVEMSGPPNVVTIRALAAGITKAMRTKSNSAHEGKTLKEIATTIAGVHGLTVEGTIEEIRMNRATQYRETDLGFLRRISMEYGHLFSIRGDKMIFTTIYEIEASDPVGTIDMTDVMRWTLRDKTTTTYKSAQVKYHDPVEKKVVQADVNWADISVFGQPGAASNLAPPPGTPTEQATAAESQAAFNTRAFGEDTLVIQTKAENGTQAQAKAKAGLHRANTCMVSGDLTIPGNPLMVAGNNFQLTGMGKFDGKYQVQESKHGLSRTSGYVTDISVKKVGQ